MTGEDTTNAAPAPHTISSNVQQVMEQLGRADVMIEIDPLRDLDLETTIRLRWVVRDIRARRTKLMALSSDDLALLEERGLITMNDGEPELMDAANSIV